MFNLELLNKLKDLILLLRMFVQDYILLLLLLDKSVMLYIHLNLLVMKNVRNYIRK